MKLYKYRGGDLQRHLKMLGENEFWASRADQLNDPSEAYVNDGPLRRAFDQLGASDVGAHFSNLTGMRHTVGVYSLTRAPFDELMWAYYAQGHTGFCIEYDFDRLLLEARSAWSVVNVVYHESPQTILLDDILVDGDEAVILAKMIGTKSSRWAHEQETRIVTATSGINHYAAEAVTGIYFGCRCDESFIESVCRALRGRPLKFYRMRFSAGPYAMTAEELPRPPGEGDADAWLAPIEAHAIPTVERVDERERPYHAYLARAVERVRRDPSCEKIILADFSVKRKNGDEPVILVQYETNVPTQFDNVVNRYFEIDELSDAPSKEA